MFFDEIASGYDSWYDTPLGRFADLVETALAFDLYKVRRGDLVLDAGCGTGNFTLKLAQKGARVVGIDISPKMLALARIKAAREKQVTFHQMDLYHLDFPPCHFDGIVSMAAFEFIHEPQKVFHQLMAILKPGGQLLIGTINRDSAWGKRYLQQAKRPDSIFRHARFMNLKELRDLDRQNLEKSGECLFIKPDTPEGKINMKEEERARVAGQGGFMATLWRKPRIAP